MKAKQVSPLHAALHVSRAKKATCVAWEALLGPLAPWALEVGNQGMWVNLSPHTCSPLGLPCSGLVASPCCPCCMPCPAPHVAMPSHCCWGGQGVELRDGVCRQCRQCAGSACRQCLPLPPAPLAPTQQHHTQRPAAPHPAMPSHSLTLEAGPSVARLGTLPGQLRPWVW